MSHAAGSRADAAPDPGAEGAAERPRGPTPGTRRDAPWPDVPEARRNVMRANKSKDTKPELVLRSLLHRLGYRYRLHPKAVPGRPDIAFPGRRKAIFVHGCFWHGHDGCRRANVPKTRTGYWLPKLAANRERDGRKEAELSAMGWQSMTVWECELADPGEAVSKAARFLGPPRGSRG